MDKIGKEKPAGEGGLSEWLRPGFLDFEVVPIITTTFVGCMTNCVLFASRHS
jgi:hypothetical protein